MSQEIQFKQFEISKEFFKKFYDLSGAEDGSKGFLAVYVNQEGKPTFVSQFSSPIVEMGLLKALETFGCALPEIECLDDHGE